jgi:hypothetical protein
MTAACVPFSGDAIMLYNDLRATTSKALQLCVMAILVMAMHSFAIAKA